MISLYNEACIYEHFYKKEKCTIGFFVLGEVDNLMLKTLGAINYEIVISKVTIEKNIKHHKDLALKDYEILDMIIGKYDVLMKDGEHTVGIVHTEYGEYFYALKVTKSKEKVFLTSFRRTSKYDIKRFKNRVNKGQIEIIKGSL